MSCFAIMRGSRAEINDTPIVDGQFFIETDQFDALDLSKFNKIYIDKITNRIELGVSEWSALIKPFNTIDTNTLNVDENNVLSAKEQSWDNIIEKPFETIGNDMILHVENGELKASIIWNGITNKPFYTIGEGLNVDVNGNLNANVASVSISRIGLPSRTATTYQSFTINNVNTEIIGTKYMEYEQTLSTTDDIVFRFENSEINADSMIEVYTSIWGVDPKNISVANNICAVTFPKYSTATNLTCRIYILS